MHQAQPKKIVKIKFTILEFPLRLVVTNLTGIHEDLGMIPGLTSGLRIQHFHKLWCRWQTQLDLELLWLWHRPPVVQLQFNPSAENFHMLQVQPLKDKRKKKSMNIVALILATLRPISAFPILEAVFSSLPKEILLVFLFSKSVFFFVLLVIATFRGW